MSGTGDVIYERGLEHQGEEYYLGAEVPLTYKNWRGPWDCSLFASKMVFEASGIVYGCIGSDPRTADPYTGAWGDDARRRGNIISIGQAKATKGAALLRLGQRIGHIVISDGKGGTIEAMGREYGVRRGVVDGRRWDMGVLVPGIKYDLGGHVEVVQPVKIFRVTDPYMRGDEIELIQRALLRAGMQVDLDGIYGPRTATAAAKYQTAKGLVVDGEVGPDTLRSLGVIL